MTMSAISALLFAALISILALVDALPVPVSPEEHSVNVRHRRKVAQLEVGSTPMDYMIRLKLALSDERGTPKNYTHDPTSVWCFMDKDINEQRFRAKPANEGLKCKTITRYLFSWDSVTNAEPPERVPLKEGRLRPYLQVINRHVQGGKVIPVELSVELNVFVGNNRSETPTRSSSAQLQTISVSSESSGWLELDITSALAPVWPPTENLTVAEILLMAEVDCSTFKKVPLNFINPAEIPLERATRRERHLDLQPLLLVFSDDSHVKDQIAKGEEAIDMSDETFEINGAEDFEKRKRRKRQDTENNDCRVENFTVNFSDLGVDDIISPELVNIRRCMGSCSHSVLKKSSDQQLATNHAKIMASAQLLYTLQRFHNVTSVYTEEPKVPCCVPVEYSPVYVLRKQHTTETDFAIELKVYPNFVVERCGCR